jgi:hypothetical protein
MLMNFKSKPNHKRFSLIPCKNGIIFCVFEDWLERGGNSYDAMIMGDA